MTKTRLYAKAFLITLLIFLLGVFVATHFSEQRHSQVLNKLSRIELETGESRAALLYFETFKDSPNFCERFPAVYGRLADRVDALGAELTRLEEVDVGSNELVSLKKQYSVLNAQLWLYFVNFRRRCPDAGFHTVLYFYSNLAGQCARCLEQGAELAAVKQASPQKVFVFAFEAGLGVELIDWMKQQFNVRQLPAVVIDESGKPEGFSSRAEIEEKLK